MPRHSVLLFLGCVGVGALWAAAIAAQSETPRKYRRAQTPDFRRQVPDRVFFEDVLSRTVGERPVGRTAPGEKAGAPALSPENVVQSPPGTAAGWSRVISATTLEDEIKSLKLEIDKVVTTPTAFAGGGHKPACLHFSLLALLFAIVQEYDADVRWKSDAASARSAFARTAANLKAGGSIQVFHEAKRRQQELDELVRVRAGQVRRATRQVGRASWIVPHSCNCSNSGWSPTSRCGRPAHPTSAG